MKSVSIFLSVLAAQYVAGSHAHSTPYNLKFLDTHLPQQVADELLLTNDGNTDAKRFGKNGENFSNSTYQLFRLGKQGDSNTGHTDDRYLCEIHSSKEIESQKTDDSVFEPEQESSASILQKAMTLVHDTFPAKTCLYAYDLRGMYWTYALCSGDKIIQYHEGAPVEERGKKHMPQQPSTVFILGRFSKASINEMSFQNQASETQYQQHVKHSERSVTLLDEKPSPYSHHATQKAVSQIVTDGSMCDMTLQPRTVEVVYKCDGSGGDHASILDVLEIKTCHYRMFVHVPSLCQYAPFSPDKNTQDAAVDIQCQRIEEAGGENPKKRVWDGENSPESPHEKFQKFTQNVLLRDHPLFPVRADNKIDVADHFLVSLGRGFYFAESRTEFHTPSTYFNTRNVVVYNGFSESLTDLITQFAKVVFQSIGSSLLAPGPQSGTPLVLQWSHSFIAWYEIYDHLGNFLGVARIERDASDGQSILNAQLLDPITLLDVEGDMPQMVKFERPEFEAPHEYWNFQYFSEKGNPLPSRGGQPEKVQMPAKKSKGTKKIKKVTNLRPIVAYNTGVDENNQVQMKLVDKTTGEVLDGWYANDGNYVFSIDTSPGHRQDFAVKPLSPDQDFMGFTVKIGLFESVDDFKGIDEKDSSIDGNEKESNEESKGFEQDIGEEQGNDEPAVGNIHESKDSQQVDGHDRVENKIQHEPHQDQSEDVIHDQPEITLKSEVEFENINVDDLSDLFSEEFEHLLDEL